jgi:hypothetical protein
MGLLEILDHRLYGAAQDEPLSHEECNCAPTVHESNVFIPFGLLLSEKQIPRFVGNVSS